MNYYNIATQNNYDQINWINVTETRFLGLINDNTHSWKEYVDQFIKKISTACFALRNIKYILPSDTQKLIYFAHIHSTISYSIIFRGGSSYANRVFILHKKAIRIITNVRPRDF
jgi:hypothetical protein